MMGEAQSYWAGESKPEEELLDGWDIHGLGNGSSCKSLEKKQRCQVLWKPPLWGERREQLRRERRKRVKEPAEPGMDSLLWDVPWHEGVSTQTPLNPRQESIGSQWNLGLSSIKTQAVPEVVPTPNSFPRN